MSFFASLPLPAGLQSVRDFLCVGPHRASGVSVFRMNKSSYRFLGLVQLLKRRSAPKRVGTPSPARELSRVQSNFLLCDANGNSASVCRKWPCLEPQAGALNQRSSDAPNICGISSRNLNRRRNRTFGISKKIPDISAGLCLRWRLIASARYGESRMTKHECQTTKPLCRTRPTFGFRHSVVISHLEFVIESRIE